MESLRRRVSAKLEEGDFKGAMHLACSKDILADHSDATFMALKDKHPSPRVDSSIPPPPDAATLAFTVSEADVIYAINSFPCGSAGGPDGLRPQHLKDMLKCQGGDVSLLLSALAAFVTLVLEGKAPPSIRPFFLVHP